MEPDSRTLPQRDAPAVEPLSTQLVIRAESGPARADVERFWYSIYVEEMGLDHPRADHGAHRLFDPFAEDGHLLVARTEAGAVAGSCLVMRASDVDLGFYHGLFDIRPGDPQTSVTTKMLIAPAARRTRLVFRIAQAAYGAGLGWGLKRDYVDCQPSRLAFFERLGYRPLEGCCQHPYYGESIRLRLDLHDLAHLEAAGSPFLSLLEAHNAARRGPRSNGTTAPRPSALTLGTSAPPVRTATGGCTGNQGRRSC